jgi:hypothetical protein
MRLTLDGLSLDRKRPSRPHGSARLYISRERLPALRKQAETSAATQPAVKEKESGSRREHAARPAHLKKESAEEARPTPPTYREGLTADGNTIHVVVVVYGRLPGARRRHGRRVIRLPRHLLALPRAPRPRRRAGAGAGARPAPLPLVFGYVPDPSLLLFLFLFCSRRRGFSLLCSFLARCCAERRTRGGGKAKARRRKGERRVRFAADVVDNEGATRPVRFSPPAPSSSAATCGDAARSEDPMMPANREALYRGMLRDRSTHRVTCSY